MSNETTAPKGITALIYRDGLGTDFSNQGISARVMEQPVGRASAGAAGCRVQCRLVAELRRALAPVVSTTFFGCCPSDSYVPAPPRLAPPSSGPAGRNLLRRSCVAYFLRNFPPLALRVDRAPSGTAPQASPAAKKQRGERGSWPVTTAPPTNPLQRTQNHERAHQVHTAPPTSWPTSRTCWAETPKESFVLLTMQGNALGATLRVDAPPASNPGDYAQTLVSYSAPTKRHRHPAGHLHRREHRRIGSALLRARRGACAPNWPSRDAPERRMDGDLGSVAELPLHRPQLLHRPITGRDHQQQRQRRPDLPGKQRHRFHRTCTVHRGPGQHARRSPRTSPTAGPKTLEARRALWAEDPENSRQDSPPRPRWNWQERCSTPPSGTT
jgi:hypothetical protein